MTQAHPTHVRCIDAYRVCHATTERIAKGLITLHAPQQLYMVLGTAHNVALDDTGGRVLIGEFEAFVLGDGTRFLSRECRLMEDETSRVLAEHVFMCPYEVSIIYMAKSDPVTHYRIYPLIRLLQMV